MRYATMTRETQEKQGIKFVTVETEVKEISENNTVQDAPKVATSEEEIAVKKPASFGKLLKSVK